MKRFVVAELQEQLQRGSLIAATFWCLVFVTSVSALNFRAISCQTDVVDSLLMVCWWRSFLLLLFSPEKCEYGSLTELCLCKIVANYSF